MEQEIAKILRDSSLQEHKQKKMEELEMNKISAEEVFKRQKFYSLLRVLYILK